MRDAQPAAKKGCLTCLQSTCVVCPWRTQKAQQQPDALIDEIKKGLWAKAFAPYGSSPGYFIVPWDEIEAEIARIRKGEPR